MRLALLLPLALVLPLTACSGSESSTPPTGAVPTHDAGAGDATTPDTGLGDDAPVADTGAAEDVPTVDAPGSDATSVPGTCESTADCGGKACLALGGGAAGWHTCATDTPSGNTECLQPGLDECCSNAECAAGTNGLCGDSTLWYCGGADMQNYNVCFYDACQANSDCTAQPYGVCVPSGAFGEVRSSCAYGGCLDDVECASRAGGACVPFFDPCNSRFMGLFCTYQDSVCKADSDCAGSMQYCAPGDDGVTSCETWYPPP